MADLPTNRTTANTPAEHVADHNTLHATHNLIDGDGADGDVLTRVSGAATWAAPSGSSVRGALPNGYAQVTANQGSITSEADLTGLSATVTVNSGERIRVSFRVLVQGTAAADIPYVRIKEGATVLQICAHHVGSTADVRTFTDSVILTPSAGSHTYNLSLSRQAGSGTLTMVAGATFPAYILVEGIGT